MTPRKAGARIGGTEESTPPSAEPSDRARRSFAVATAHTAGAAASGSRPSSRSCSRRRRPHAHWFAKGAEPWLTRSEAALQPRLPPPLRPPKNRVRASFLKRAGGPDRNRYDL